MARLERRRRELGFIKLEISVTTSVYDGGDRHRREKVVLIIFLFFYFFLIV